MSYDEWEESSSEGQIKEFNVYDFNNRHDAAEAIAYRVALIQQKYKEVLELAAQFEIDVQFQLSAPENLVCGWNSRDHYINWNASSAHC